MEIKRPESKQPIPPHAVCVFHGEIFSVYQWKQKMFDGSFETFEKVKRRDTATVIPITKEGGILITHQEQPGMQPFIGFPGGVIAYGEDVLHAAKRELVEETGYKAATWRLWHAKQLVTEIDWALYTFIARDCELVEKPALDTGEKITVEQITFAELLKLADRKDFRDSEIAFILLQSRVNEKKMEELHEALFG